LSAVFAGLTSGFAAVPSGLRPPGQDRCLEPLGHLSRRIASCITHRATALARCLAL